MIALDAPHDVPFEAPLEVAADGSAPVCSYPYPGLDPSNPPPVCGPDPSMSPCSEEGPVATCPAGCMARTTPPAGGPYDFRIGRLRVWAPSALLSLAALVIDPNVDPKCFNDGGDTLNWLLHFDPSAGTLAVGSARSSADGGTTYVRLHESSGDPGAICPLFAGVPTFDLSPQTTTFTTTAGEDSAGPLAHANLPIFDAATGIPVIFPLSEITFAHVRRSGGNACIGSWDAKYWCDGDTLGWTTDGVMLAKISVEESDGVPVKTAACQSLCAILVNDATKTSGGRCKRGADGKVLPGMGDACIGGAGCNDAFLLSFTFSAYAVNVTP